MSLMHFGYPLAWHLIDYKMRPIVSRMIFYFSIPNSEYLRSSTIIPLSVNIYCLAIIYSDLRSDALCLSISISRIEELKTALYLVIHEIFDVAGLR